MMNIGVLVSAAIRPNDSADPIATAFAKEIRGGLHTVTSGSDKNSIIFERREWGMMCYVVNEDKVYQLKYNYSNTNIMDNNNWVEFSGTSSGSSGEWLNSVLSVSYTQPSSPTNGDRYIVGLKTGDTITGAIWSTFSPGTITQWISSLSSWQVITPSNGFTIKVDNQSGVMYKYDGIFPSGEWEQEKMNQIRDLFASTSDSINYVATSNTTINYYQKDMIFLTKFSSSNSGNTASIDINGLGQKYIKKTTSYGVGYLTPNDIRTDVIYSLLYDGVYFQLNKPHSSTDLSIKHYIEAHDHIVVPPYYQYWVYSDLTIAGTLVNYGQVVVADGAIVMSGGTFSNFGTLALVSTTGTSSIIYNNTDTIQFSESTSVFGPSVSAIVKSNALTASHLHSVGGATAGYILSVNNIGLFDWKQPVLSGYLTHLDKDFQISSDISGDGKFSGLTISATPFNNSYVCVFVNGLEMSVGYGSTVSCDCYFSSTNGTTAKSNNIATGDGLYWNSSNSGSDLHTGWRLSLLYMI